MAKNCLHCQLPSPQNEDFCCKGCELAYQTINRLGFSSYYKNRILSDKEINLKPVNNPGDINDISDFLSENADGTFSAYLFVKGIHCGACVWLIESILKKQENVSQARINMSNKRLHIIFSGEKSYANQLVQIINNLGYNLIPYDFEELNNEEKKYNNDLLKALSVAGFGAGNIMLMSVAIWSSDQKAMGVFTHSFLYFVSSLIALPVIIYSGRIFFKSAWNSLKSGFSNMDIPISVAIILVTLFSLFEIFTKADHAYFDSAVMLIFFLLIGRYLDFLTRKKAFSVAQDFSILGTMSAVIIDNSGKTKVILAKNIKKGMILKVAIGDKIAADGRVIEGESDIDTSIITGESLPQKAYQNDKVFAGTVNLSSAIKVLVTTDQKDSLITRINELVTNLQNQKNRFVRIADKISRYYTPMVHILAAATCLIWYFVFGVAFKKALLCAVAVLIITCPCALALAVPIVTVVTNSRLLKKGIIIKSGEAVEKLDKIDVVVFDKTGTITLGQPSLQSAILLKNGKELTLESNHLLFKLAASISSYSNHPLSKSLSKSFDDELLDIKPEEIAGKGLLAHFEGKEIKLGKKEFALNSDEISLIKPNENPQIFVKFTNEFTSEIAIFTFTDAIKTDAFEIVSKLKSMKKEVILLSGDKEEVVIDVASKVGINNFYHSQNPLQKAEIIKDLKTTRDGKIKNIFMVGDGINDAPPLMASDIAISFGKASDIAKNCADVIIQGDKLQPLIDVILIGKKSNRLIKENFALSFAYNIIAVPFAVLGYVTPLVAAISMSLSSVVVVLNSIRK